MPQSSEKPSNETFAKPQNALATASQPAEESSQSSTGSSAASNDAESTAASSAPSVGSDTDSMRAALGGFMEVYNAQGHDDDGGDDDDRSTLSEFQEVYDSQESNK